MTDARQELIDGLADSMIHVCRDLPRTHEAPQTLLSWLTAIDPSIPDEVWIEAAARACRKRSEDLRQQAEDLWLYGQLRTVEDR